MVLSYFLCSHKTELPMVLSFKWMQLNWKFPKTFLGSEHIHTRTSANPIWKPDCFSHSHSVKIYISVLYHSFSLEKKTWPKMFGASSDAAAAAKKWNPKNTLWCIFRKAFFLHILPFAINETSVLFFLHIQCICALAGI